MLIDNFSKVVQEGLVQMLLGDKIGEGQYREVYDCYPCPQYVVKVEASHGFCNMKEFEIYMEIKEDCPELLKWLARPVSISKCGSVMIQEKTNRIHHSMLPKHIPTWITDEKISNWGEIDGKIVCHDYGNNFISRAGFMTKKGKMKMKMARWRNET